MGDVCGSLCVPWQNVSAGHASHGNRSVGLLSASFANSLQNVKGNRTGQELLNEGPFMEILLI